MTYEEIKEIRVNKPFISKEGAEYSQMIDAAIEKQIPKKPMYEADGYFEGGLVFDMWRCPSCNKLYEVGFDHYDFCPNCGQAIDFTEEGLE